MMSTLHTIITAIHLLAASAPCVSAVPVPPITVHAEFAALNYTWDATHTHAEYVNNGGYIVENNILAGIKVDKNKDIYLTVPRWLPGVPSTLNKLVKDAAGAFVLQPFPSWDIQREGEAGSLQNCQSMLIDSKGIMWVIEVGRRNFFQAPFLHVDGAAGIWLINVASGAILEQYYFPEEIMSYNTSFLNDIVLDEARDVAYLTDASGAGGIVVYDHKAGLSRRYSGISTANEPSYEVYINGDYYGTDKITTPSDGIALSSDGEYLYYCAVQGDLLYRLPTAVLRDFSTTKFTIDASVVILGKKKPSDGMAMWSDVLYFGALTESTYYALDLTTNKALDSFNAVPVWPDTVRMRWIDTFSLDLSDPDTLWFTSNALDVFIFGSMDFSGASGANMRVLSVPRTESTSTASTAESCEFSDSTVHMLLALTITFGILLLGVVLYFYVFSKKKLDASEKVVNSSLI